MSEPRIYYQDEAVTLYCGDCRDVLPTLDKVDHVITDPPYDEQTHSRGGSVVRYDGGPQIARIPFAPLSDVPALSSVLTTTCRRWMLVFCAVRQIERWATAIEADGWRVPRVMIWVKPDASPQFSGDRPGHGYESILLAHPVGKTRWNGGGHKGVFEHCRIDRRSGFHHPTQKPEQLMAELVMLFSDEGDTILDPFAGSGTTLVGAKRLGRKAIGIEINEQYCEVAAKRLAQGALPLRREGAMTYDRLLFDLMNPAPDPDPLPFSGPHTSVVRHEPGRRGRPPLACAGRPRTRLHRGS